MVRTSGRLLALLLLPGCFISTGCAATLQAPGAVAAHLEHDVRMFEAAVMNAYNGGDAARAASFYADDAFVFVPGQPRTGDHGDIAEDIARYMQDPHFSLGYVNQRTSISASGDLAYTRGKLMVTYTDRQTNSPRTDNSNYLLVMRRAPNSEWRVVEDISF